MSRRRNLFNRVFGILLAIFCTTGYAANIPRGADGKPDLNGTWQVMNRANYDLQIHAAKAAMALRDGPFGPVPANREPRQPCVQRLAPSARGHLRCAAFLRTNA